MNADFDPADPATPYGSGRTRKAATIIAAMSAPDPSVRIRTIYEFSISESTTSVEFVPIDNVPGFSHRVVVNGIPFNWLSSDYRPSKDSAKYFFALANREKRN